MDLAAETQYASVGSARADADGAGLDGGVAGITASGSATITGATVAEGAVDVGPDGTEDVTNVDVVVADGPGSLRHETQKSATKTT